MTEMTDELLARIAERAGDPKRRYLTAAEEYAEGQLAVELPIEEIERRYEERDRAELARGRLDDGGPTKADIFRAMQAQRRAWGNVRSTMWVVERDGTMRVSGGRPQVKPLESAPGSSDWDKLEHVTGRQIPEDLRRLYSIADGGFGPGFTGLNSVETICLNWEDFRRRGPDYCGTIDYPAGFLPIAGETLDYHYDLDTGRIISSNQNWDNCGLEREDIYDIAFQSLAAMMEDWLKRS